MLGTTGNGNGMKILKSERSGGDKHCDFIKCNGIVHLKIVNVI